MITTMLRSMFVFAVLITLFSINPLMKTGVTSFQIVEQKTFANDNIKINHLVKGKDVYIECVIPGFSFVPSENKAKTEGYIQLYVNGKEHKKVNQAAFVIKDLPKGTHRIKLELVQRHNPSSQAVKEISVQIK